MIILTRKIPGDWWILDRWRHIAGHPTMVYQWQYFEPKWRYHNTTNEARFRRLRKDRP